ncbi:FAD binding domain-containing protein [Noviherbaspirillum denitrificans]|uniref:FAD-binding PCMH-type domain-containing protein n=1 Tax=Noviherbaspirillum denitrificans TaxID=1968433 RepID=A0A254TIQ5_9BURK|nr:FAD binding domain-containing protein [Noviherbaspirillum denitrificans]OWW20443.1 hypothetical protein AYR66_14060 [Noviherbaspirillum denitrificans]
MKAAPFDYIRTESLAHALDLLGEYGPDAKLIAGGQSLVPMLAMRLARPTILLDINRLPEIKGIADEGQHLVIGAATRQRDAEDASVVARRLQLMRLALRWVGHDQTRNRGTIGGSLVHADPSAELPLTAVVMGVELELRSKAGGVRKIPASEFFFGPMSTAVREDECLTRMRWPTRERAGYGAAFEETAIRHGDFAMASAACEVRLDANGVCSQASIGLGGVDGVPLAFPDLAAQVTGHKITTSLAQELAHAAAVRAEPGSDVHASAGYRRHLARELLTRCLLKASVQAAGTMGEFQ